MFPPPLWWGCGVDNFYLPHSGWLLVVISSTRTVEPVRTTTVHHPFPFCVFAKVVAIRGELACSSFGRNRLILQQKQQKTEHTQRAFSFAMKEIAMDKTRWIGSGFFLLLFTFTTGTQKPVVTGPMAISCQRKSKSAV